MKKAIVVGATSGIGKALAQLLVSKEYKVGITGRRTVLLQELKSENPNAYCIKSFDIAETKNATEQLVELTKELGGLDLLIISSGTGDLNPDLNFDIEEKTIQTNVLGFTQIAKWAFRFFEEQQFGHLVAISSIAGIRGSRHAPAYNASKAYQINYLEALTQKAIKTKLPLYVTDVRPGFVDTAMAKGDGQFWVAGVNKASVQIINAIENKKKIVYISKRWKLIAILLKIMPRSIYDRI
jgi:short-subunit dehydrogenase